MKIPKGYTEQEVLDIIDRVVNHLAPSFVFGAYDSVDIKQYGRLKALEAIESGKYEEGRPLDKFIYSHVRYRYINLKRDKYSRKESPCDKCPFKDAGSISGCKEFNNKSNCELWAKWSKTNSAKKSLAKPGDLAINEDGEVAVPCESRPVIEHVAEKELLQLIDKNLPASMRSDWLKLKAGVKLSKDRTNEIYMIVKGIVNG